MKMIRNCAFAMYLDYKASMRLNPVLTSVGTVITVLTVYSVLGIFGLV